MEPKTTEERMTFTPKKKLVALEELINFFKSELEQNNKAIDKLDARIKKLEDDKPRRLAKNNH